MKHLALWTVIGAGTMGVAACAHSVPIKGSAAPSASISYAGGERWTAQIAPVMQSRGDLAQGTRGRSYGSAEWTRGDAPSLPTLNLSFTYAGSERDLSWAILAGGCGIASLPLIPLSNFPELNASGGGRSQVTATLPIDLPNSGSYHLDICKDRQGGADSLGGCGNLKYVRG